VSTRLDQVLQKYPAHEDGIRTLAARDPSGNLKYLDWGARMLAANQALAEELSDIIEMFHRFNGQWFGARRDRIHPDIYSYRPQDLASLRDNLLKIKRKQDRKRKQREKLYRLEGPVEAEIVYDSPDLIVRHIKNKQASVHYGLGTKWCISMLREGYFEEYESNNATFFFFERKVPLGDEHDKMALMMPRAADGDRGWRVETASAFTSLDEQIDIMILAKVHGPRVFDIFKDVYERSERYPGSVVFQVYQGTATAEQLAITFETLATGKLNPYEVESLIEAICCNDATPSSLLDEIVNRASSLAMDAWKQFAKEGLRRGLRRRRGRRSRRNNTSELMRNVFAAIAIHPQTSAELRDKVVKSLRRRRVDVGDILVVKRGGRVGVAYGTGVRAPNFRRRHRRYRRRLPLSALRRRLKSYEGIVARTKKLIKKLEHKKKVAEAKKKAADKSRRKSK
jgi:hypothetical protein